jgi:phosphoribosyl-ATP pyrophosphohydrolase
MKTEMPQYDQHDIAMIQKNDSVILSEAMDLLYSMIHLLQKRGSDEQQLQ